MKKFIVFSLTLVLFIAACSQPFQMTESDNAAINGEAVESSVASAAQPWDSTKIYYKGDQVSHAGKTWVAGWWTQGEEPGTTGEWGVWKQATDPVKDVTVTLTASKTTVAKNESVTLSWISQNAATITASGGWTGSKALSGSELVGPLTANTTFTLTAADSAGVSVSSTVTITVSTVDPDPGLKVGESRVLTDAQVTDLWNGIDARYLPAAVANTVPSLMTKAEYERMFPRRYGSALWSETSGKIDAEYFLYENLVNALTDIAAIKVKVETKRYCSRVFRLDKATKTETLLRQDSDWNADWLKNVVPTVEIVDYGKFLNEGTAELKKRDLAAFLGNLAHETTGGWDTAPGGRYAWGFYFKEEVGYNDNSVGGYVSANHAQYPAKAGESYHGRGPIQLSWNYNYGYMSQIIYGDKMILLNNPDSVAHDGKLGWMTAIWFWMTPQSPKPACHDVMVGNWTPTAEDIAANRLPGFGVTVNVINGGLEAGRPDDYRVKDRIGFYDMVCKEFGISMGENVDCYTQRPF